MINNYGRIPPEFIYPIMLHHSPRFFNHLVMSASLQTTLINLSSSLCSSQRPASFQPCFFCLLASGFSPLASGLVEMSGFEPLASCLQGRRSPSWATPPNCNWQLIMDNWQLLERWLWFSTSRSWFAQVFNCQLYIVHCQLTWWAWMYSNHRPHAYQACALTTWATGPNPETSFLEFWVLSEEFRVIIKLFTLNSELWTLNSHKVSGN